MKEITSLAFCLLGFELIHISVAPSVKCPEYLFRFFPRPCEPNFSNARYKIGATAEIYEYGEQEENSLVGLRLKARIRQRIKVLSARRQIDGQVQFFSSNNLRSMFF